MVVIIAITAGTVRADIWRTATAPPIYLRIVSAFILTSPEHVHRLIVANAIFDLYNFAVWRQWCISFTWFFTHKNQIIVAKQNLLMIISAEHIIFNDNHLLIKLRTAISVCNRYVQSKNGCVFFHVIFCNVYFCVTRTTKEKTNISTNECFVNIITDNFILNHISFDVETHNPLTEWPSDLSINLFMNSFAKYQIHCERTHWYEPKWFF